MNTLKVKAYGNRHQLFWCEQILGLTMLFHVARPAGRKDNEVSGESNDVERKDWHSFQRSILA